MYGTYLPDTTLHTHVHVCVGLHKYVGIPSCYAYVAKCTRTPAIVLVQTTHTICSL